MVRLSRRELKKTAKKQSAKAEVLEDDLSLSSIFIRRIIPVIVLCGLMIVGGYKVRSYVYANEAFRLSSITVHEDTGTVVPVEWDLLGRISVFDVDLQGVYRMIAERFPEYKDIALQRVLPNEIAVTVTKRQAVCQLRSGRYFPLDKDMIVLPFIRNLPMTDLPIVVDQSLRITDDMIGSPITSPGLISALALLEAFDASGLSGSFKIYEIDVTDANNVFFYIAGGLEVRIGDEPFAPKLALLSATADKVGLDAARIRYIDLRFEDVVIGPK